MRRIWHPAFAGAGFAASARSRRRPKMHHKHFDMNHDLLKSKSRLVGLLAILACSIVSCGRGTPPDVEKLRSNQFLSEDLFLSITNGSSVADVRKILGSAVRHQFTVAENGHTWTLIKCFLHTGEEESYNFYQLLFRDDALVKTIGWIRMEMEAYSYEGTAASRLKPWDIEDMKYVKKAIEAPVVTHGEIRAELKDAGATMKKFQGKGNLPAVVILPIAAALSQRAIKEFPINEELRQRYDGCKASIGMTIKEVDALMASRCGCLPQEQGVWLGFMGSTDTQATLILFSCFRMSPSCLMAAGMSPTSIATLFSATIGIPTCHQTGAIKNESDQITAATGPSSVSGEGSLAFSGAGFAASSRSRRRSAR